MNNIRIIFFDIDGTLLPFSNKDLLPRTRLSLLQLQKQGIRLFLATGRAPYSIPKFNDLTFDGALCFNGGYCFAGHDVIYKHPVPQADVPCIIKNAQRMGLAAVLATSSRFGCNFIDQNLEDYLRFAEMDNCIVDDFESMMKEEIYQIMVGTKPEQDDNLIQGTSSVKIARWWDRAVDVIPNGSGKAPAIEKILSYYGYSIENCMAFGDGGNDLDMIQYAGIGVAMGNAVDRVREAADYVTEPCDKDGIYHALVHYRLIDSL